MSVTLSIVIVNYNVKHFLEQTLTSVFKALKSVNAEVFVVDNNSVDGSVDLVKVKFPNVTLIENKENTGFAVANNQAIRKSTGEFVLLLNPDTLVEEDTFEKCIAFMQSHQDCGGLGVRMVDGSGNFLPESKRGLPTPAVAFYKMLGLAKLFPASNTFGKYHLTFLDEHKTHEIDVLSGAFMFMRKAALDKSGLLDEDFFMYGEDIDLSYRLTKAGYKNYYYPHTRIIHYKGESTKKTSVNYVFVFYNAMIIFARKHFSSSRAGLLTVLIKMAIYLKAGSTLWSNFFRKTAWMWFDGISIFAGMYFLKTYWEENHKWVPGEYPPEYMRIAVPAYILIWLSSVFISGGYDKPFKTSKVVRGIVVGGLLISALSNFLDAYRFSKALIVLGSFYAAFSIIISRLVHHFVRHGNFMLGESRHKRIALVGNFEEVARVEQILSKSQQDIDIIGHVYQKGELVNEEKSLGKIENLAQLVDLYKMEELIFCAKDISSARIIDWMTSIRNPNVEYKIVPDDSNFIIGSSSKNTQGEYYTFDIALNIHKKENQRKKRFLDILVSLILVVIFPINVFTRRGFQNFGDAFRVLFGAKTWVSPDLESLYTKKGVFTPAIISNGTELDEKTAHRLSMLYAKDYSPALDIDIILRKI